jgi:hypothetical protein
MCRQRIEIWRFLRSSDESTGFRDHPGMLFR